MRNFKVILYIFIVFVFTVTAPQVFGSDDHDHGKEKSSQKNNNNEHEHKEDEEHGHEGHDHGKEEVKTEKDDHKGHDEHAHDEHGHDEHEDGPIKISKESQDLAGIETAKVTQSSFSAKIAVSGRIAQDVEVVKYVFSPEPASIEQCHAALGSNVEKDEVLCVVTLINNNESFEIKAPISGTIISEFVKIGEHIDETTAFYAIADLSKLWANFDVYEKDVASVKLGQKIIVSPLSYSDKSFEGKIVFISPRVDESTYTVKIRAEVENKNYLIKLGMSVRGEILVDDETSAIAVPAEAIQTVENKTVVFKKTEDGHFEPQEVEIKSRTKESVAISHGLEEGDEIVVKGSFILKSKKLESEMGHDHAH
ncbi:MAG: efflux RND transporter periplasmic adaptor subunit [Candidatus Omnitrophica bacterium]|nr:efflux RND transporter periplasmic adaptor subunit [Candidatus Omnitrophota bacterium]